MIINLPFGKYPPVGAKVKTVEYELFGVAGYIVVVGFPYESKNKKLTKSTTIFVEFVLVAL